MENEECANTGKRKAKRGSCQGKQQRGGGPFWVQTMVEVEVNSKGKRQAKTLKVVPVEDRTAHTLQENSYNSVDSSDTLNTDCWSGVLLTLTH